MITSLLLSLSSFLYLGLHDSDKAYYTVLQLEDHILVKAEFPWTFRKALLDFEPSLQQEKTQEAFDQAIFDFVESSFLLYDIHDEQITLIEIKEVRSHQHAHQVNYEFQFEKAELKRIENRLMFNINSKQENIHQLILNGELKSLSCSPESPSIQL